MIYPVISPKLHLNKIGLSVRSADATALDLQLLPAAILLILSRSFYYISRRSPFGLASFALLIRQRSPYKFPI